MKRQTLLITAIALAATTSLSAQVKKGDLLLGATMGLNYGNSSGSSGSGSSSSNANIAPRIGFGIGHNSVMGFRTNFGYSSGRNDGSTVRTTSTSIGGSVYWRKFIPIKGQIGWYAEPSAGVSYVSNVTKSDPGGKIQTQGINYSALVIPGIYYQPLSKLLISVDFGGLGVNHHRSKDQFDQRFRNTYVNLSLLNSFTFGVDFVLGKG